MVNRISSLEDKASAQVAIDLCQKNGFKEVALCLEKPTYGGFIAYEPSQFVSDPEKLLLWVKMKKDDLEANLVISLIQRRRGDGMQPLMSSVKD